MTDPTTEAREITITEAGELLLAEDRYLIAAHEKPDGDAWGSLIGLHRWLESHGKDVVSLVTESDLASLPQIDEMLGVSETVRTELPADWTERRIITTDLAGLGRLGFPIPGLRDSEDEPEEIQPAPQVWLQLDHHPDNSRYATHNGIFPDRPATAQILWEVIREAERAAVPGGHSFAEPVRVTFPKDPKLALPLAVGLLTDTLSFSIPSTNSASYVMAGELLAAGVNVPELTLELQKELDAEQTLGLLTLLARTKMLYEDQLCVLRVSREELTEVGLEKLHTHHALASLRQIKGTRAFLVLVEDMETPGLHKGSLRSSDPNLAIASVARSRGGGGHEQAAGFRLIGTPSEIEATVGEMVSELGELIGASS